MRFVVGKGGVGKSTMAAATALAAAREGLRVLAVSLDQAHSLATIVGLGEDVAPFEVRELDTLALLEQRLTTLRALIPAGPDHDHTSPLSLPDPQELTALPGAQELLGLIEVVRLAESGQWDQVVVDCPPTADALRLLTIADLVADGVERMWPRHSRVTLGAGSSQWQLVSALLVDRLVEATAPVRALLGDADRSGVRVVTQPRRVDVVETRRMVTALALLGMKLDDVVINGVLPQHDSMSDPNAPGAAAVPVVQWYARRIAEQDAVVAELRNALTGTSVLLAHDHGTEPVGLGALGLVADDFSPPGTDPAGGTGSDGPEPKVELESGGGVDSVYALRIPLPLVDPASLTLGRVGDDLMIGAAGVRRRWPLAPVLRRCETIGAGLDGDDLVIRFRPDAAVWPQ